MGGVADMVETILSLCARAACAKGRRHRGGGGPTPASMPAATEAMMGELRLAHLARVKGWMP